MEPDLEALQAAVTPQIHQASPANAMRCVARPMVQYSPRPDIEALGFYCLWGFRVLGFRVLGHFAFSRFRHLVFRALDFCGFGGGV